MIVKGQDISISINDEIVSCWRSSTLTVDAETIGKSTVGSGNWKEFEGVALSWTVSGEGLIYNDEDFTIHDAYDLMITLATVTVIFSVSDVTYSGDAIITNITETGNVNDNGSFNISLQGTGELAKATIDGIIDSDGVLITDSDDEIIIDA